MGCVHGRGSRTWLETERVCWGPTFPAGAILASASRNPSVTGYSTQQGAGSSLRDEAGVDVRRYIAALRRSRRLIVAIVAVITGAVLALSLVLPNVYRATATIVLDVETGVLSTPDADSIERRLATTNALLASDDVLVAAAEDVPGETAGSIGGAIESSVNPETNLIDVVATHADPDTAAVMANAVSEAFLSVNAQLERRRFDQAVEDVRNQIAALEGDPNASNLLPALRTRLSELLVQSASAGADLQIAVPASPPSAPASPRPLRNTMLALFASLFLGVFVALGRDQLRPRLGDPRELSQVLGIPVLAGIPQVRRRFGRRDHIAEAVEHEAYETLRGAVEMSVPAGRSQVIMVTSAVHAEGKTTATARLGRALARAGKRTLLISADLRWPALHQAFDLPGEPGLSDLLRLTERAGVSDHLLPAATHAVRTGGGEPLLEVLTSGHKPPDPARLLSSPATHAFFEYARTFDYDYILVDGPPMLGIADAQALAREADHTLLVAQLERLTADHVIDMGELIERLDMRPLGLVVIGTRVEVSPYYLSGRRESFEDAFAEQERREVRG
jgi:capsular exopolysaccharide synthesis family protein